MDTSIRFIQLAIACIIFIGIIVLMVRKKSNASSSLIWIFIALSIIILGIFPQIIDFVAEKIGINYPPTLVMIAAIGAILWITFYLSSELSVAQTKIRELAMQISLLNNEMLLIKEKKQEGNDEVEDNSNCITKDF